MDVVVAGALIEEQRILLCHRSPERRWYPDVWDLPGGHVEAEETPAGALRRELLEELGVTIGTVSPEPVDRLHEPAFEMTVWIVEQWEGVPENHAHGEHDRIGWFTSDELPSLKLAHPSYFALLSGILIGPRHTSA